jgi:hypothetical protein
MSEEIQESIIKDNMVIHHEEESPVNLRRAENNLVDAQQSLKHKVTALLMAVGLGLLFDYFFAEEYLGLSVLIFTMVMMGAVLYSVKSQIQLSKKISLVWGIPSILLALSFSLYNNPVLKSLNILLIPLLITGYLITVRYEQVKGIGLALAANIVDRMFNKALMTSPKFISFSKEIIKSGKEVKENATRKSIIRGLMISIPLLIIIIMLLSSADMMFNYYIQSLGDLFGGFNNSSVIAHTFLITLITLYMFGLLWSFKYSHIPYQEEAMGVVKACWEPVTMITILVMVNTAYLLFTVVQAAYLYGGGADALPIGFSYAEYARRGFFELILVTIINFAIVMLGMNLMKKGQGVVHKAANLSYSLLIVFTFNMLGAASYKMYLYESAFGFTRLRVFVQVFMILIGILLIILLLGIWVKKTPVLKYSVIAALTVYTALNFINIDRIIAKENILRYEETGKIDVGYIINLSYDAMPEIVRLLNAEETEVSQQIREHLERQKEIMHDQYDQWYEYNYYKSQILNRID